MSPQVWARREGTEHETAPVVADAQCLMRHAKLDDCELSIVLCDDAFIQALNRDHRGKDQPTDVLSFAMREGEGADEDDPVLGDLVISVDTARRQAEARGHAVAAELRVLLVHGFLHLLGYDHEVSEAEAAEMRGAELRLLAVLDAPEAGLIARAAELGAAD